MHGVFIALPLLDLEVFLHTALACLQVDKHREALNLYVKGQEHVLLAGRLAKKGVEPTELCLTGGSCEALTAMLAAEQHHCLFRRVRKLTMRCTLSKAMLQVKAMQPAQ
jgi:hypothetical protein